MKKEPKALKSPEKEERSVSDWLNDFSRLEGFLGVAFYTPTGEPLAVLEGQGTQFKLREIGPIANNVLLNAQKASLEMGTGQGSFIHFEAQKAHILVRCLDEGAELKKPRPGKAHIHLVLVLKSDTNIGLAKLRIQSVIRKLAAEFRV